MNKTNKFLSGLLSALLLASPSMSAVAAGLGGFMPVVLIPRGLAFMVNRSVVDTSEQIRLIRQYD